MDSKPTQQFRRAILGRSDLVSAIARNDLHSIEAIAEQLGLHLETNRPAVRELKGTKSLIPQLEAVLQKHQKTDSSSYPNNLEPIQLWLNTSYQVEAPLLPKPAGPAYVKWNNRPTEFPKYQFLSTWREVGPRLQRGLMDSHSSKQLDIKKLVSKFAKRELTAVLPRKRKRRWGRRVLVIKDTSLRLSPFLRDHDEIIRQLENLLPVDCLTIAEGISPAALYHSVTRSSLREPTTLKTNAILPESQILVLSDLGCLADTDLHWKTWLRWAKRTDELGCHLLALLPSSELAVPPTLRSLFSIQSWQRSCGLQSDFAHQSELLEQLFVVASPALRVEPGLLRDLRLLLPERTDASLEADFWSSELLSSNHPWGATLDFREVNAVLRPKFEKLDQAIRRSVLDRIRSWRIHMQHAPEVWFEELLCLDADSQSLFPQDIKDAYACFRELTKQIPINDDDRTYMHRLTQRASDSALANNVIGDLIRDAKRELHPEGPEVAAGTDPRELPAGPVRRYELHIINDRLRLSLQADESSEIELTQVTALDSSTAVFRIETTRTEPESRFWKSGKKPEFVSAFGRDTYGAWFEFEVPRRDKQGVVTQRMRWIRPGTFMMGSPEDEPERRDNEVLHEVRLTRGFWLADTACTQAMWEAVMGENPSNFKAEDRPVEEVSYEDVVEFCKSVSKQFPGLMPQLPTEAQWEYACRAGTQTPFSFGSTISTEQANFKGNFPYDGAPKGAYREETVGVKDLPANAWGLYQMHGNVWEWCSDWYTESQSHSVVDPPGAGMGSGRVLRGGSWFNEDRYLRAACRGRYDPDTRSSSLGFRLLSSASAEPSEMAERPVAEQGSELSRIGAAEEIFREFRVRVENQEPAVLELDRPTKIRVVCNLEAVELQQLTKPEWAVEFGRDAYGVYGDFEVESKSDKSTVLQRLRWIPPGSFEMGSPPDEPGRSDDEALHSVTLTSGFWMFDAPCSQRLWTAIMDENPSHFPDPDRPVESVDWEQANEFTKRLGQRLKNQTFELPTEAQWEYSCRAGTSTAIYTGPLEIIGNANAPALDAIAWYGGNSGHNYDHDESVDISKYEWLAEKQFPFTHAGTRQIKKKVPNPWGLYDMLGNVWEWCVDWYGEYPEVASVDPHGPESGSIRVLRGGSWINGARYLRSACRDWYDPGYRDGNLGFRLLSSSSPVTEQVSGSRRIPRDEAGENQRTK